MDGKGYPFRRRPMPFKKIGPNKYKSPSGKTFTKKQVTAYYASGGTFKKAK
jgi:hypothetical protein